MIKPNSQVKIKLKSTSHYYHSFLDQFMATIITVNDNEIVIHSPIKNSSEKQWTIFNEEIDFIEEIK